MFAVRAARTAAAAASGAAVATRVTTSMTPATFAALTTWAPTLSLSLATHPAAAAAAVVVKPLASAGPAMSAAAVRGIATAAVVRAPATPGSAAGAGGVATEPEEAEATTTPTSAAAGGGGASAAGGAGGAPGDAAAAAQIKALTDEVNKLKAGHAELTSSRLSLLADMENVRRIASRDVDLAKAYALQTFSKRLLDVVDNLGRAVESVPEGMRGKREGHEVLGNLYEGVAATHREMLKTLAQFGITPFGAKGEKFDPNRHEAMMQVPATEEAPADTVALLLKQGFTLKERVLRPAQVAVAVKPEGA